MNLGTGESVSCQFNPKELKLTKKNSWKLEDAKSQNTGILNFSGGTPTKLTLELLFDTTSGGDVRPTGQIMMTSESNMSLESSGGQMTGKSASGMTLETSQAVNIKGGQAVSVKGSRINLN